METFIASAFQHAPWSLSKAQVAIWCPFRFQQQHVLKEKGIAAKATTAARVGKAAHQAFEWVLTKRYADLSEALQKAIIRQTMTTVEMDDLFALGHSMFNFLSRLEKFKEKHQVTDQYVEKKFAFDVQFNEAAYWGKGDSVPFFRGVWDLCLRTKSDHMLIIDHKAGMVKPLEDNEEQLKVYAVAGLKLFPGTRGVQGALNFIQSDGGVTWAKMRSAQNIQEELIPWFIKYVNRAATAATKTGARKGYWCAFCQYTDRCPLKRGNSG